MGASGVKGKLWGTFLPLGQPQPGQAAPPGISLLARDFQVQPFMCMGRDAPRSIALRHVTVLMREAPQFLPWEPLMSGTCG